jgi:hypothetical protein
VQNLDHRNQTDRGQITNRTNTYYREQEEKMDGFKNIERRNCEAQT